MPVNLTQTFHTIDSSGAQIISLPNTPIGPPAQPGDPDRQVAIAAISSAGSIPTVTVNGNATNVINAQITSISGTNFGIWTISLAVGTTANIVLTFAAATGVDVSIGVFNLQDASVAAFQTDFTQTSVASTSLSLNTITIPASGAAIYLAGVDNSGAITWTNATAFYDDTLALTATEASVAEVTTAGTPTVSITVGVADLMALMGASWSFVTTAHAFLPFRNVSDVRFR